MKTFVLFITDQDVDKEDKTDAIKYYRTLPGMVRNYFGNIDKMGPYNRSYGYVPISPSKIDKVNIVENIKLLIERLPDGFTDYRIPVVIDTTKTNFVISDEIRNSISEMEKALQAFNQSFSFALLNTSSEFNLVKA